MEFDKKLTGKILDPIHGTIRITDIEVKVMSHPLFQRLRNIKQNTFLYKVFPSAVHSRFEHSLGVMDITYKMLNNLIINSYRYKTKYHDGLVFEDIDNLPCKNIQELRLAALLHDVGHGPMSHQFDFFMMSKTELVQCLGCEFSYIYELIDGEKVEHEHISLILIHKILHDLHLENEVNVNNIISIIESNKEKPKINIEASNDTYNLHPIFTSLISSCPIDADRMDYLLRDSYFSGVKCGIYNVERILMSIVPVVQESNVYLAYKESSLDSISEFVFSRENLFSQVYFHKTNRSFSAMLSRVCKVAKSNNKQPLATLIFGLDLSSSEGNIERLEQFYLDNSDDYFINETVCKPIKDDAKSASIINDIVNREPWKKFYEAKVYRGNISIKSKVSKEFISTMESEVTNILQPLLPLEDFIVDIMSDNAFKDIDKSEVKLLVKKPDNTYECKPFDECGYKLDTYQSIKYFIRIFVNPNKVNDELKSHRESVDELVQRVKSNFSM